MIKNLLVKPAVLSVLALLAYSPAHALSTDPLIEGAKLCTRHLPRYERQYGIPVHLLSAISSTESGRPHKALGIALPWPWTINAAGKGYYFDSKEEAVAAAKKLRKQGVKSMDVGCMQVNLVHHADAFRSLEQAFDPEQNIAYAASFLRNLYEEQDSWRTAAASYHSKTPLFGSRYVSRVYDRWYTIIDRVRSARISMAKAAGSPATGGLTADEAMSAQEAANRSATTPAVAQTLSAGKVINPGKRSTRMIKVRDAKTSPTGIKRENGILVVRPPAPVAPKSTSAAPRETGVAVAEAKVAPTVASQPKIVPAASPAASGPRFIFND